MFDQLLIWIDYSGYSLESYKKLIHGEYLGFQMWAVCNIRYNCWLSGHYWTICSFGEWILHPSISKILISRTRPYLRTPEPTQGRTEYKLSVVVYTKIMWLSFFEAAVSSLAWVDWGQPQWNWHLLCHKPSFCITTRLSRLRATAVKLALTLSQTFLLVKEEIEMSE
jgi:hypothetical protein